MKKALSILGVVLLILGLGIIAYQFRDRFNKKPAGLEVNTTPISEVYLDGKLVGETPYANKSLTPGNYTVKIVPRPTGGETYADWETQLSLSSLVTTVINRSFAATETDTSGSLLRLLKEPGGKTYLSVISDPDTINVTLDGTPHGFTPLTKIDTTPGSHLLILSSPGYQKQDLTINTVKGYNLIVSIKLAGDQITLSTPVVASPSASLSPIATSSATPAPSVVNTIAKPYVVVQETGTGWLRVRKEPSSTADELGKANVGEKLKYLGESTETGWHKIEFEGTTGWVSGKYVDLVE